MVEDAAVRHTHFVHSRHLEQPQRRLIGAIALLAALLVAIVAWWASQ